MTKPRLVKVRALFYVFQHVTKEAAPILTQPLDIFYFPGRNLVCSKYFRNFATSDNPTLSVDIKL